MEKKVGNIILAFTKAVKALQIYGIKHSKFRIFYVLFYEKLVNFLKKYYELNIQIERFTILHSNRVIYEEKEKDISIAFRLFRDGIRNISFTKGLSTNELLIFLEIIGQQSSEQDTALRLWESDFSHINLYIVEEEDEPLDYKIPVAPLENIDYDAKIEEIINKEKIDVNTELTLNLNLYELKNLKTDVLNEQIKEILPLTIKIFIDFLSTERSQEVIDSLIELLKQCIENGYIDHACRIVHTLQKYPDINVLEKFENETTILGFRNFVEILKDEDFDEFIMFLGFFSKKSIPYFLKMMISVKRQDRLELLRRTIAQIAQNDHASIVVFLKSEDVMTLINAIAILGIIGSKNAVSNLQPLINHAESTVRAEVVLAFKNIEEPSMIVKFLDDPNSDVRIKALHVLTEMKYPCIYPKVLRRIKRKDFLDLNLTEQKDHFNCLVANGEDDLITNLKEILFKRQLLHRKKYRIMRKFAAIALSHIDSDEASEILQQGANHKHMDIKFACKMALR